jgi:hypothetical protein
MGDALERYLTSSTTLYNMMFRKDLMIEIECTNHLNAEV